MSVSTKPQTGILNRQNSLNTTSHLVPPTKNPILGNRPNNLKLNPELQKTRLNNKNL